jgi:hypothetical protein
MHLFFALHLGILFMGFCLFFLGSKGDEILGFDVGSQSIVPVKDPDMSKFAAQVQDMVFLQHWDVALCVAWLWEIVQGNPTCFSSSDHLLTTQVMEAVFFKDRVDAALKDFVMDTKWLTLRRFFQSQCPEAREAVEYLVRPDAIDAVLSMSMVAVFA